MSLYEANRERIFALVREREAEKAAAQRVTQVVTQVVPQPEKDVLSPF